MPCHMKIACGYIFKALSLSVNTSTHLSVNLPKQLSEEKYIHNYPSVLSTLVAFGLFAVYGLAGYPICSVNYVIKNHG
jgi:hypothetical protein